MALKYIKRKKEIGNWDELMRYIDKDLIQEMLLELKQRKRKGDILEKFISIIFNICKL